VLTTTEVSDIPSIPPIPPVPLSPQPTVPCCSGLKSRKVLIGVLGGLIIVSLLSTAIFGAYQLGKNQTANPSTTVVTPTIPAATPSTTPVVDSVSDPTANWKTNVNTKSGYSFKYPDNWFIDTNNGSELLSDVAFRGWGYPDYIVSFSVDTPSQLKVSVDDPIGTKKQLGDKVFETKIADLTVSGHKAAMFQEDVLPESATDAHNGVTVKVVMGDKYLYVEHWENLARKSTAEVNTIFDQILSTFKFLDQTDETAGWETYSFPKFNLGYKFKAPNNYVLTTNEAGQGGPILQSLSLTETNASGGPNDFGIFVLNQALKSRLDYMSSDNFKQTGTITLSRRAWTTVSNQLGETQYLTEFNGKTYSVGGKNIPLVAQVASTFQFESSY